LVASAPLVVAVCVAGWLYELKPASD